MKLLFDENLSPRLVELLEGEHPGSAHVRSVGLRGADDDRIWDYARDRDFTIVSKDNDFRQRSFLEGAPPKIVWLEVGNAGTAAIAELLRREHARLLAFESEDESALRTAPGRSRGLTARGSAAALRAPPYEARRPPAREPRDLAAGG